MAIRLNYKYTRTSEYKDLARTELHETWRYKKWDDIHRRWENFFRYKFVKRMKYAESLVDKHFKMVLEEAGGLTFKNHPMTNAGIPDRIVHYLGTTFYVEMKSTGEACSPLQIEFHKRLKERGIETYVLDTRIENINDLYLVAYTTYEGKHYRKNPHKV